MSEFFGNEMCLGFEFVILFIACSFVCLFVCFLFLKSTMVMKVELEFELE